MGIYGVAAHWVENRRRDVALRLALGGAPGTVLAAAIRDALRVILSGLCAGLVAALALTGTLASLLHGVSPRDPRAMAATAGFLLGVSLLACLVPALRTLRVDPASMLRED